MEHLLRLSLIALLLGNLAMLGCNGLRGLIRLAVAQGTLLALVLWTAHPAPGTDILLLAAGIFAVKGVCLPGLLTRTLARLAPDATLRPYVGHGPAVLAGIVGMVLCFRLGQALPLRPGLFPPLLVPVSLATLLSGLMLIVTRSRALAQVIGYLAAENGIFLLGVPLMVHGAVWFELALLLDVFVAVFVMGIAVNRISDTFSTTNSDRFCSLHD